MSLLIICDQRDELDQMGALAAAAGFEGVSLIDHPAAALDWCETHAPDVVLIDFLMRASNGIEVIRRLRAIPGMATVPLVLMLPHGFETVSAEAYRQGATDFLAKPLDPTEFMARINNLLALRAARLEQTSAPHAWNPQAVAPLPQRERLH